MRRIAVLTAIILLILELSTIQAAPIYHSEEREEVRLEKRGTLFKLGAAAGLVTGGYFLAKKRAQNKREAQLQREAEYIDNSNSAQNTYGQPNVYDSNSAQNANGQPNGNDNYCNQIPAPEGCSPSIYPGSGIYY